MNSTDIKPTKLALEHAIIENVQKDNINDCSVHFEYKILTGTSMQSTKVSVFTFNPKHQEKFLLTTGHGDTDEDALIDANTNISDLRKKENSYTVIWKKHSDESHMNTSYFVANDIQGVLNKFNSGKDFPHIFLIYEIKLNPIS